MTPRLPWRTPVTRAGGTHHCNYPCNHHNSGNRSGRTSRWENRVRVARWVMVLPHREHLGMAILSELEVRQTNIVSRRRKRHPFDGPWHPGRRIRRSTLAPLKPGGDKAQRDWEAFTAGRECLVPLSGLASQGRWGVGHPSLIQIIHPSFMLMTDHPVRSTRATPAPDRLTVFTLISLDKAMGRGIIWFTFPTEYLEVSRPLPASRAFREPMCRAANTPAIAMSAMLLASTENFLWLRPPRLRLLLRNRYAG